MGYRQAGEVIIFVSRCQIGTLLYAGTVISEKSWYNATMKKSAAGCEDHKRIVCGNRHASAGSTCPYYTAKNVKAAEE